MRIIAGDARGRRLFAPAGTDTRPTADRVRESLFNVIARSVPDARVLDLFAGSGALALEALSRGAAFAHLNDPSRAAVQAIRRNVEQVGWQDRTLITSRDWRGALASCAQPFDLVFLDPPYRMREAYAQVACELRARGLLSKDALITMERSAKDALALTDDFEVYDERRYGDTAIALVRMKEAP